MTTQSITGVHPVAQLFPPLAADEFAEFLESVKRDGLLTPVTIDPKGVLLDGRNRLKACELAGIEPRYKLYKGDPVAFILAANIHRRHLNASQCALIVALVYPDPETGGRGRTANYSKLETFTASRLSEARKIVKHSRDLAGEVIAGLTTFQDALHFAEHPVEDEHVEPLPEPGDPVVLGTTSRRWSALRRSSHVTGLPDRTGPWWDNLDVEQLVTDILAADLRAPGFAHAVSDALLKKLGS